VTTAPWLGDACSLVDAYRAGTLTPTEVVAASLAAIEASDLNAVAHVDAKAAIAAARSCDVELPFGGVPIAVKELEAVTGWPATQASLVFSDEIADEDSTQVARLRAAGAIPMAQTTASEFGGINCTHTKLHGTTRNPWDHERTPGGSSGGSAAAVAGGLVPIASGGDGGGSLRIPAGFCGLFALKSTFGRIPKGPHTHQEPLTVVVGCVARSVRDTARWFDVCNGFDPRDTLSLPRVGGWERDLDTIDLVGKRASISIDLGTAIVEPRQAALLTSRAETLIAAAGMRRVETSAQLPRVRNEWALTNLVGLFGTLGDRYPDCYEDLTREIQLGLKMAERNFTLKSAGAAEQFRTQLNERMADLFEQTDVVFCATNPDVAFGASGPMATTVGGVDLIAEHGLGVAVGNNGALTIPANLAGNPAVTIPSGQIDGLPVGLQVMGRHHEEPLLLAVARVAERAFPWPLVALTP